MRITRRTLLKQISVGAVASGVVSGTVGAQPEFLNTDGPLDRHGKNSTTRSVHDLLVTIVATTAVPYGTALIKNLQDSTLRLTNFTPGTIAFNDYFVELVQTTRVSHTKPLILEPGETRAFQIPDQRLQGGQRDIDKSYYVWADDSVQELSSFTMIAKVSGRIQDGRAILYAYSDEAALVA